jgi:hypothetical protein
VRLSVSDVTRRYESAEDAGLSTFSADVMNLSCMHVRTQQQQTCVNDQAPGHNLGLDKQRKPAKKGPPLTMAQIDFWIFCLFVTAFWLFVIIMLSTTGTPANMGRGVYPATERQHVIFHLLDERSTPLGGEDAGKEFTNKQDFGLSPASMLSASPAVGFASLIFLSVFSLR